MEKSETTLDLANRKFARQLDFAAACGAPSYLTLSPPTPQSLSQTIPRPPAPSHLPPPVPSHLPPPVQMHLDFQSPVRRPWKQSPPQWQQQRTSQSPPVMPHFQSPRPQQLVTPFHRLPYSTPKLPVKRFQAL